MTLRQINDKLTGHDIPAGGTTGQFLVKVSNTSYDVAWTTFTLGAYTTSDLPEGSNLYYTDERVDDRVAALIQNGTGITWTYNDGAGTLTGNVTITQYTDEMAQDAVGNALTDSNTIDFTYNDAGNTITADLKWAQVMGRMWIGI